MRHDILTATMNKAVARILFPLVILATILAFTLALAPSVSGSARAGLGGASGLAAGTSGAHRISRSSAEATPTPSAQAASRPGSTSGIVVMGFAIALIILLPILLQRSLWTK